MENKIAIIGIIVKNIESVPKLNKILSEYGEHIIGRMGIPHKEKETNIITIVIESTQEIIDNLSNKIKTLDGISNLKIKF